MLIKYFRNYWLDELCGVFCRKMWPNSQFLGSYNNRYRTMGENMAGDMAGDVDFETVRSKRRKRNESAEEMEKIKPRFISE